MQDVTVVSDVPTPFHNHAQLMTKQEISMPDRTTTQPVAKWEISVANKLFQVNQFQNYIQDRETFWDLNWPEEKFLLGWSEE